MPGAIALEAAEIVTEAAQPVRPGETIKGQLRNAAIALGYPAGHWRVRAAWYGEAESWSARALDDLRRRGAALKKRRAELNAARDATEATKLLAIAQSLENQDAEFYRAEISRLRDVARRLGCGPVDEKPK